MINVHVELHPVVSTVIFLIVWSPVPGVFPEVGDANSGQQFQKAQGKREQTCNLISVL